MHHLIGLATNWLPESQMQKMLFSCRSLSDVIKQSSIQKTADYHDETIPPYLNAVVLIETPLDHTEVSRWCKVQELKLGRNRLAKHGECEADFDLLLSWNSEIVSHVECEPYYKPLVEMVLNAHTYST